MKTVFLIPKVLRPYADGNEELHLGGATVGSLLIELRDRYPALYPCICDETGVVRRHLHLFVNQEMLLKNELASAPLQQGDVVSLFQAVSGG
jgi:molybdopterin converting factor small subunit